jgi:hypothetical protein
MKEDITFPKFDSIYAALGDQPAIRTCHQNHCGEAFEKAHGSFLSLSDIDLILFIPILFFKIMSRCLRQRSFFAKPSPSCYDDLVIKFVRYIFPVIYPKQALTVGRQPSCRATINMRTRVNLDENPVWGEAGRA